VQSLVLEELRALLRDDVSDPALADVQVVGVVLSVDYRNAKVHFVLSGSRAGSHRSDGTSPASPGRGRDLVEHALARATPFLRARLADSIEMKRVPDLHFVWGGVASSADEGGTPSS
jgi:ribosome-binding factor A